MATLSEMVESEASRAEAETDAEPEEEVEHEPVESPYPDEEPDDEEPVAFDPTQFEREQTRHEKALRKVFGPAFASMEPCGDCGGVGFLPTDFTPPPAIVADPTLVVCGDCNGYGQRSTPSLNDQYAFVPCTGCSGAGYRDRDALEAIRQAEAYASPSYPPAPPPQPVWNQATQQWETPDGRALGVSEPRYPDPASA